MDELEETRGSVVDLEIRSASDLSQLAEYLGDRVHVLFNGRYSDGTYALGLEVACKEMTDAEARLAADANIQDFVRILAGLPDSLKQAWKNCHSKVFDVGFVMSTTPSAFIEVLSPATVEAVSRLGAGIQVTIYPHDLPKYNPSSAEPS